MGGVSGDGSGVVVVLMMWWLCLCGWSGWWLMWWLCLCGWSEW